MVTDLFIPLFDLVGTLGFLVGFVVGVRSYRGATVHRPFWLAFAVTAGLGVVWLALVSTEWLGVGSTVMDQLGTTVQAVVIGLYAVGVVGTWAITDALDRSRHETRQRARLVAVLSRVLRHNLRNEMTVIRGYTAMAAEQLDELDLVTAKIDGLIEMSEKARGFEQTALPTAEPSVALDEMLDAVIEDIRREYPAAEIATDVDTAGATVGASIRTALTELVENAARHAGERPEVHLAVEATDDPILVRVRDNGPGLPEPERELLSGAIETPLAHGSGIGLWMAQWIVQTHGGDLAADVTEQGTTMTAVWSRDEPDRWDWGTRQDPMGPAYDRYHALFDRGVDAHLILDDQRRVLDANELAGALFSGWRHELLGRPLGALLPDAVDTDAMWRRLQREGVAAGQLTLPAAEQPYRYVAVANITLGEHVVTIRNVGHPSGPSSTTAAISDGHE